MSNISDIAVLNEMRRLRQEVQQLKAQMSLLISQSNLKQIYALDADLDDHTGDSTIHFTEASIDHDNIQNIGSNDHATIDTHIADTSNPHSTTLQQSIAANDTATSTPKFVNRIEFTPTSSLSPAVQFLADTPKTERGGLEIQSDAETGAIVPQAAITLKANGVSHADDILRVIDRLGTRVVSIGLKDVGSNPFSGSAQMYYNNDADDIFIHEKLSGVTPTGTWNFTGNVTGLTAPGESTVYSGTSNPGAGYHIWFDTTGSPNKFMISWQADGSFFEFERS